MPLIHQATLNQPLYFQGIALHAGTHCSLTLYPAEENHGVVFLKNGVRIPATVEHVLSTAFCVKIGSSEVTIQTIEHLMCALLMNQVSNVLCHIEGEEVPVLDGSASLFSKAIASCGLKVQSAMRKVAKVIKTLEILIGESRAKMSPMNDQRYSIALDYDHPALNKSSLKKSFSVLFDDYLSEIDRARTYGFLKDQPFYEKYGLAQGASVHTALIFDDEKVINPEGSRMKDEITSHKILDCIGDLSLLGGAFLGHYEVLRPGHGINVAIVRALIDQNAIYWENATEALSFLSEPAGVL